jgi:ABC-type sugar transport system permease subunit
MEFSMTNNREEISRLERLRRWFWHHRDAVLGWTILTPMVIYFFIFVLLPLFFLVAVSVTEWNVIMWPPKFVGLENFRKILTSAHYRNVILRTIAYALAILALNVVGGFTIALILNQGLKGKGVFRTLWYLPGVLAGPVIAKLMRTFLSPSERGILNIMIGTFGVEPIPWYTSAFWMPIIVVLFSVWRGIGWTVVFFLSGLQSIDVNLYDAAKIDGASRWQILRYITIPQMTPILVFISVTGLISSMQMWETPLILTQGGPQNSTYTLVFSMYMDALSNLDFGVGTAQGVVLLMLLSVGIGFQLRRYYQQYVVG